MICNPGRLPWDLATSTAAGTLIARFTTSIQRAGPRRFIEREFACVFALADGIFERVGKRVRSGGGDRPWERRWTDTSSPHQST